MSKDNKNTVSKTENFINQVTCVTALSSGIRAISALNPATEQALFLFQSH